MINEPSGTVYVPPALYYYSGRVKQHILILLLKCVPSVTVEQLTTI